MWARRHLVIIGATTSITTSVTRHRTPAQRSATIPCRSALTLVTRARLPVRAPTTSEEQITHAPPGGWKPESARRWCSRLCASVNDTPVIRRLQVDFQIFEVAERADVSLLSLVEIAADIEQEHAISARFAVNDRDACADQRDANPFEEYITVRCHRRNAHDHPATRHRQPDVGLPAHPRRTRPARHHDRRGDSLVDLEERRDRSCTRS